VDRAQGLIVITKHDEPDLDSHARIIRCEVGTGRVERFCLLIKLVDEVVTLGIP